MWLAPALAEMPSREDALKAEIEKLRKQVEAPQVQVQALQEKKARADREAAEKYQREFAEMCLEAILKGEHASLIPLLSKEAREFRRGGSEKESEKILALHQYANSIGLHSRDKYASSYKITSVTIAPDSEEAIFRGNFLGKTGETEKVATFALHVCREKESQRYVIGFISVSLK